MSESGFDLLSVSSNSGSCHFVYLAIFFFFDTMKRYALGKRNFLERPSVRGAEKLRDERSVPYPVFRSQYFSLLASLHWEPCTCFSVSHHHYLRWDRISTTGRIGYFPFPQVG